MNCAVCRAVLASCGVLCEECRDELSAPLGLLPEQILATIAKRAPAALVDHWGRHHPLEARTLIGRNIEGTGLQILEASISRHHAHLAEERDSGGWTITDLGAANGTFVNEQPLSGPTRVQHGDRIGIGQVGFYLVTGAVDLPEVHVDPAIITTIQPNRRPALRGQPAFEDATTEHPLPAFGELDERGDTDVGLPDVELRLVEPTGGGGGLLDVAGVQVQLTPIQFELIRILANRMTSEPHQASQVRGFVRSSELLGELPWDTRDPDENHVKQLVRRTRRALTRAGIGDLVESRHRFGYRLRVVPQAP